jgi:hypothetical protein
MRKYILSFMAIVGAAALIGFSGPLWAQTLPLSVTVHFDSDYFDSGQPMGVTVTVANTSGKYLLVNKGFQDKVNLFYLEMRLIDPAGRLLLPTQCPRPRTEFPDTPPLPFVVCTATGVATRVAPYEVLPPGWSVTQRKDDLRDCYQIKLSGQYSAEVQLSVMIFSQSDAAPTADPCNGDIKNVNASLGVVKSEPKALYKQGSIEVNIVPQYWLMAWKQGQLLIPDIAVAIWPEAGRVADDYSLKNIQLNNVVAQYAFKTYAFWKNQEYLLALFDTQKAINSLGSVVVGQQYPVVISGTLKNREYFSGGQKVQIIGLNR